MTGPGTAALSQRRPDRQVGLAGGGETASRQGKLSQDGAACSRFKETIRSRLPRGGGLRASRRRRALEFEGSLEKFGGVRGSSRGAVLCSFGTMCAWSPVARAEVRGTGLPLAPRETSDQGRGRRVGRVSPGPQESRTARFLLFVGLSVIRSRGRKRACAVREECSPSSPSTGKECCSEIGFYPRLSLCTLAAGQGVMRKHARCT